MGRVAVRWAIALALPTAWLLLAPAAEAAPPPSPVVTVPATADFTVQVSAQPIHFEGTVAGPVGPSDRVFVANYTANPADPPARCTILLGGSTTWACDAMPAEAIGDYELRVTWFAPDPPFGDSSAPTVLMLHVVPDAPPPTTAAPMPAPSPTETTSKPKPKPKPSKTAEPDEPTTPPAILIPPPADTPAPVPPIEPEPEAPPPSAAPAAPVAPALRPWDPTDHPRTVLGIGIASFTLLTLIGPAGLAMGGAASSGLAMVAVAGSAAAAAAGSRKGSVKSAKVKLSKFAAEGAGGGDSSVTWRAPGWRVADAWGTAVPNWLATRSPLAARILIDGAYLRAMFGTAWLAGILGGLGLGFAGAHQTGGLPIPPSLALTTALLVLALFDATWGVAGVLGFAAGMLVWHSSDLGAAAATRSFLGLAALWFAIPLIAAAARPFRRPVGHSQRYGWDRLADAVIAALIAGWATQKTVGGLPGLSGLDLPMAHHADRLALIAIATVLIRVMVEELAAWRYPLRLGAAAPPKLPFAGPSQRLLATGLRTALFAFLAIAFIGNCWQLWVGTVLFVIPQVLTIYERSFPNSERLKLLLPEGIVKVLVMLLVGTFFGRLVFAVLQDPDSMLRNGFILLSLPGLALSLLGLFGHDGPDLKWTWPRQALGCVILLVSLGLVLTGW